MSDDCACDQLSVPINPWKQVWCYPGMASHNPYPYPSIPITTLSWCYPYLCHPLIPLPSGACFKLMRCSRSRCHTSSWRILWLPSHCPIERPISTEVSCILPLIHHICLLNMVKKNQNIVQHISQLNMLIKKRLSLAYFQDIVLNVIFSPTLCMVGHMTMQGNFQTQLQNQVYK
jgi:hypothetical protein